MGYNKKDVENLIENLDIVEIIGEYVELKKSGSGYKGLCPFHDEKTPSFSVSPEKGIYNCFGCGAKGNALQFYMEKNGLDFITAIEELAKKYNYKLRNETGYSIKKNSNYDRYYSLMEEVQKYFGEILFSKQGILGLEYLKNRGLDEDFLKRYHLGYAIDGWNNIGDYLKEKGYTEQEIFDMGLIKKGEKGYYDTFRGRVIFPIFSPKGKTIGFGGRILNSEKSTAKYLNSPETKIFTKGDNLYGFINKGSNIRKNGFVMLMEGYMDVLAAHKNGFANAVASLGTSLTEKQASLMKKYTQNIVICYDMDNAGRKAVERASIILKRYKFNIRVLELSEGKDPDEYLMKNGKEKFKKELRNSIEIFDFLYNYYIEGINLNDIILKKNFIYRFKDFFNSIEDEIEHSIYIEKLSIAVDIPKEDLKSIFKKDNKIINKRYKYAKINKNNKIDKLEKETIRIILKNIDYYNKLNFIEIENPLLRKVLGIIAQKLEFKDLKIEKEIINNEDFDEEEKAMIIDILFSVDEIENEKEFFKDILESWEKKRFQNELEEVKKQLENQNLTIGEKRILVGKRMEIIKKLKF
ncbi:DNA primase [Haliovirga abyssi]|uniref:DNA primase n=1 Tax=Haliovirga abyssi TaxID=2996794 RepID=A0AAU9D8Y5_9FUSO|nr:DNA primase [Haliovirga abyssi]BDU49735.1 DNA primase [Haliovirga abyssi]